MEEYHAPLDEPSLLKHASTDFSPQTREQVGILLKNGADVQVLYDSIYTLKCRDNSSKIKIVKHLLDNGFSVEYNRVQFHVGYKTKILRLKSKLFAVISDFESEAALKREAIDRATLLGTDASFIIANMLYEYIPYEFCPWF